MRRNITLGAAAALLALALAVGGAGQNFPVLEMLLDIVALGVAGTLMWDRRAERLTGLARCALGLAVAILLLPLLQLVPLPPSIWQSLPGRELPTQIDAALGLQVWRPLTLDIEGTIRAVLSLIPACVLFAACLRLHSAERGKLLMMVGAFALLNALLGIAQLATGGSMTPYPSSHLGYPIGLFVNRNHNAVFLLLSMPLVAALGARRMQSTDARLPYLAGTLALLTILSIVVVATTSRMALALLPFALLGSLALLLFRQSLLRIAVPSTLILAGIAATISWVGGFNRNLARFASFEDGRFDYWEDVSWALHHYGLAGTGFGTFVPVYQTAESLSGISPSILNHAHNDFIEIVLEGGIPAIVLLLLFFGILAAAAVQLLKKRFDFQRASLSLAAGVGIALVLAFSLVDYPLRMPAISCTFALLCACFLPTPIPLATAREDVPANKPRLSSYATRFAAAGAAAVAALLVVQAGASASNLLADDDAGARNWASWSTAAHQALGADALGASRLQEANAESLAALRLSPIAAVGVRTAALARMLDGSRARGTELMQIATVLGWRDPVTQVWAIQASQRSGETDKVIQRAQALFQQEEFVPSALVLLLQDAPNGPTTRALAREFTAKPAWRAGFVKAAADLPPPYVAKLGAFVAVVNRTAAPLSVEEARPLFDRLLEANDTSAARNLWAGARRGVLVANGGFEDVSARNGAEVPSDWDISDEDIATIATQAPDFKAHGRALRISSAARTGGILSQRLMLTPGAYALSYRARSGTGTPVMLRWRLRCSGSEATQTSRDAPASSGRWQEFSAKFVVPIQDCPIQRLALERPDDIHSQEVWVDDVNIKSEIR